MFKWNRVIVALIGIPLLFFVYTDKIFQGLPLLVFTNLVVGIGTYEFYKMIKNLDKPVYDKLGIFVALFIVNSTYFSQIPTLKFAYKFFNIFSVNQILILTTIAILLDRVKTNKIKGTIESLSLTLTGIIYVAVLFSPIINIFIHDLKRGSYILLTLQILVWISDTSAGIVGMSIGRKFFKKGFTEISPKKSVEGALGSLFFTGLATVIVFAIRGEYSVWFFVMGLIVSFVAQTGDLVESLFKRETGVKDSGTILMGHGGILDRFDSMILVVPVFYFFIKLL